MLLLLGVDQGDGADHAVADRNVPQDLGLRRLLAVLHDLEVARLVSLWRDFRFISQELARSNI